MDYIKYKVKVKVWSSGTTNWYKDGKLHREDGPAVEYTDGTKYWYLNGEKYTEEEFNRKINKSSYIDKTITIDGEEYILIEKEI